MLRDASAATDLWESAFVWSLATSEEVDGTDKAAGDLFPNAVAALAAMGSIDSYEADGREELRRSRDADLIYAAITEDSLQAFHRAILEKNLAPISFVVGVVAKSAVESARSAYLRYARESSREGLERSFVDSLGRQIGDELAQSAGHLLLEPLAPDG
ncbi:MAG: hypothetical protein EXR66_10960 [Dehalococcoidia bacterium]|nr:hypothetical protein [Dehalococcoidia bacterium]